MTKEEVIRKSAIIKQINKLKAKLNNTDYKVMKYLEGALPTIEYLDIKAQREKWRAEINKLEGEL